MTDGKIISTNNDEELGRLFVEAINKKKVVIFPCETVYSICFDFYDNQLRERVYNIKGRKKEKKFSAIMHSIVCLKKVGVVPNELERKFMEKYWPGPLKIVFSDDFCAGQSTGIWLRNLLKQIPSLVATTSANKSGKSDVRAAVDLDPDIIKQVDLVLVDDSKLVFSKPTTVVRLKGKVEILRHGALDISKDMAELKV